jgi:hypothetical protein
MGDSGVDRQNVSTLTFKRKEGFSALASRDAYDAATVRAADAGV